MLAGTALYVRLMVYMGLSLFIIRRALLIYGCMRIYAYNLTTHRSGSITDGDLISAALLSANVMPFFPGHLVTSALGFKTRVDSLTYVLCCLDSSDLPMVQHLLTSWWQAWRPRHCDPDTSARTNIDFIFL